MNINQNKEYKNDGFCILKGVLPLKDSQQLLIDIHSIVRFQLGRFIKAPFKSELGDEKTLALEMEQLLNFDVDSYLAFARHSAKLVNLNRYLNNDAIIKMLKSLNFELPTIVTGPVMHINSDRLVIPNGYAGFDTHQDWPSIQGSLDCVVIWAPLVQVSDSNFPLQVIPGSHKKGLYKGTINDNVLKIDKTLYDSNKYISIKVDVGDVVVMSSWTLHQTGLKNSSGFRLACSTRYDNSAEQTFINRGYPCAYQRTVQRDMFTPGFPVEDQITKLYE